MPDVFTSPENKKTDSYSSASVPRDSEKTANNHTSPPFNTSHILNIPPDTDIHKLPGHTHNILNAYCIYPDNVKFSSADPQEKIVLLLRKHPITNIPWIFISFVLMILPSVFEFLPFFDKLTEGFQLVLTLIWYLVTFAYILENFLEWFFNINLITTERVVDLDFVNLLYREVTEAELEKIQEPTFDIGGALESFFNYGDVSIQTAAEVSRIEFESVPNPDKVVQILRDLGIKEEVERMKRRYE